MSLFSSGRKHRTPLPQVRRNTTDTLRSRHDLASPRQHSVLRCLYLGKVVPSQTNDNNRILMCSSLQLMGGDEAGPIIQLHWDHVIRLRRSGWFLRSPQPS